MEELQVRPPAPVDTRPAVLDEGDGLLGNRSGDALVVVALPPSRRKRRHREVGLDNLPHALRYAIGEIGLRQLDASLLQRDLELAPDSLSLRGELIAQA